MRRTWVGMMAVLVAAALLAAACGGSDDDDTAAAPRSDDAEDVAWASFVIVDRFGDVAGFTSTMVALDRGYRAEQLIDSPELLNPDGTIQGEVPDGPPFGVTDVVADELAEADGSATGPTHDAEVRLASVAAPAQDPKPERENEQVNLDPDEVNLLGLGIVLGEAYRGALGQHYVEEMGWTPPEGRRTTHADASIRGMQGLAAVLTLAARGYTPDQIALAMVTGEVGYSPPNLECVYIDGEAPQTELDVYAEQCPALPSTEDDDVDERASSSIDDGDGGDAPRPAGGSDDEPSVDAYCSAWEQYWASWGGDAASVPIGQLAEDWAELTAVAPGEIRADMERVQAIWDRGAATNTDTSLYDSDGPDANAVASVSIYVDERCGIDIGGD